MEPEHPLASGAQDERVRYEANLVQAAGLANRTEPIDPLTVEGNWITVRIGGYYTMYPLPEDTDNALTLIEVVESWQEIGARFARLQRAADRASQP